jgi:tetratricopeptide (TPR) repeat protein
VVLKLDPDNPDALALFAWTLATWPDVAVRNGAEALELAKRANQVTGNRNPGVLRALAAAYAEGGRFDEAVASAKQALTLANVQNDGALAEALKSEAKFYEAGSPFRQP